MANNSIYDTGEVFVDANENGEWDDAVLDNCWSADMRITLGLEAGLTENVTMRIQACKQITRSCNGWSLTSIADAREEYSSL